MAFEMFEMWGNKVNKEAELTERLNTDIYMKSEIKECYASLKGSLRHER